MNSGIAMIVVPSDWIDNGICDLLEISVLHYKENRTAASFLAYIIKQDSTGITVSHRDAGVPAEKDSPAGLTCLIPWKYVDGIVWLGNEKEGVMEQRIKIGFS